MELEDLDDEFGLGGGGSNEETDDVKGIEEMETKGDVNSGDDEGGGNGDGNKKKKPSAGSTAISMTDPRSGSR